MKLRRRTRALGRRPCRRAYTPAAHIHRPDDCGIGGAGGEPVRPQDTPGPVLHKREPGKGTEGRQLAEQAYLSKYHFMRLFKAQTGSSVHVYVRQKRLLHAARLIREGMTVNKAAAESGFSDYSAFHRAFRESFGISPSSLKK
ncbi:MAG: helix-turn-helix transcriptional regulator [Oscillospiraceae bacterium]